MTVNGQVITQALLSGVNLVSLRSSNYSSSAVRNESCISVEDVMMWPELNDLTTHPVYYAILKGTAALSKFIWCLYNFQPPFTCPDGTGRPIKRGKQCGDIQS
jgi:hypothetical protein